MNGRSWLLWILGIIPAVLVARNAAQFDSIPVATISPLPELSQAAAARSELSSAYELVPDGLLNGAESLDCRLIKGNVAHVNWDCVTGLPDGRIVQQQFMVRGRIHVHPGPAKTLARTGNSHQLLSNDTLCGKPSTEHVCGRPLGLRRSADGNTLFVADAYFGLMEFDLAHEHGLGLVGKVLVDKDLGGSRLKFTNDLALAKDSAGHTVIFFSSSSTKWDRREFPAALFEGQKTGRVFAYHTVTGKLQLLLAGLNFANGVELLENSTKGTYTLLVVETAGSRVHKAVININRIFGGSRPSFSPLNSKPFPGFPDNIRKSPGGQSLWVGFATKRAAPFSLIDALADWPSVRTLLLSALPQSLVFGLVPRYGLAMELDVQTGEIIRELHDPSGRVTAVSEIHQLSDNHMLLGSFKEPLKGLNVK